MRAVSLVVVLCTAVGCGGGGGTATLADDIGRALGQTRTLDDLDAVVRQDVPVAGTRQRLGSLLDDVPADPSSDLSVLADRARRTQAALAEVDDAMRNADTVAMSLPAAGEEAASAAVRDLTGDQQTLIALRERLAGVGSDIAKDVACDLGWDQLMPEEQSEINAAVDSGSVAVAYTGAVTEATAEAVDAAAYRQIAAGFGEQVARVVGWGQYGAGIIEKTRNLLGDDLDEPIVAPTFTHTRALYFWARVCLTPPR